MPLAVIDEPARFPPGTGGYDGAAPTPRPPPGRGPKGASVRQLGELEAEIMDRLWAWGRPATARDVLADLNKKRPLAYSTVKTVADIVAKLTSMSRNAAYKMALDVAEKSADE